MRNTLTLSGSDALTINGAENLEIDPGSHVYEGTTDTFMKWDELGDTVEAIELTIQDLGITAADDWGYRAIAKATGTTDWHPWQGSPEGLQESVQRAERDLRALIIRAGQRAANKAA